jgi:glycerol-3-phosphate dehydrogenase
MSHFQPTTDPIPNPSPDERAADYVAGAHSSREIAEALGFEPDNHHNALLCPYCGDQRVKLESDLLAEAMNYFMRHEGVGHVVDALAQRRETGAWPDAA